jgi:DNA-binding transcriptional regulator/RsmH inhibitor MraZ
VSVLKHRFERFFDYKLDSKFRVSVPSEWRPGGGESLPLRLLKWQNYGVPVLKAVTDEAFEAMIRSIEEDEGLNAGQKGQKTGLLYTLNTPVTINEQGRMLIPKKLAEEQGMEAGGMVHLFGRGTNFDIVSPRDYAAMSEAQEELVTELWDTVGFS